MSINKDRLKYIHLKFNQLKLASYNPDDYIYNYFSDLRNEIDLVANSQLMDDDTPANNNEIITDNWIEIIDLIKFFEKECNQMRSLKNSLTEIAKAHLVIDFIHKKINENSNQLDKIEVFKEIDQLLDSELFKLEKRLFCNKTMFFLDRQKNDCLKSMPKEKIGKLIFVTNEYFSRKSIENLKSKKLITQSYLTLEHLKVRFLKKLLESIITSNDNQIEEIKFDLSTLTKLDLSNNEYNQIENNIFQELKSLTKINLSNNKITKLDSLLFSGLVNLKEINLNNNLINEIHANAFSGLSNLKWLWLQNNSIENIDPKTFDSLTSLTYIHLDSNKLKRLDKRLFNACSNLSVINLSNNKLVNNIDKDLLSGLTNLECIDFSNNFLRGIDYDSFYNLKNLTHINLSHNRLRMIDSSLFDGLKSLKAVYLNKNQLDSINQSDFSGLPIFWHDYYDISGEKMQQNFLSF